MDRLCVVVGIMDLLCVVGGIMDLNTAAQMLNVKKRRLYDITNVLEVLKITQRADALC